MMWSILALFVMTSTAYALQASDYYAPYQNTIPRFLNSLSLRGEDPAMSENAGILSVALSQDEQSETCLGLVDIC
jgi:hypothetical protein